MTTYDSRSEHRATVRSAPLRINVVQKIRVETDVDIVAFYAGFDERQRNSYWTTEVTDNCLGVNSSTWGRPYDYLTNLLAENVDVVEPLLVHPATISSIDEDDFEDRVATRNGARTRFEDRYWSEADFEALVAAVPWLRPDEAKTPEDLDRTPTEADQPLWDATDGDGLS